jgi:hypothetical protein
MSGMGWLGTVSGKGIISGGKIGSGVLGTGSISGFGLGFMTK